jgi:hypothetical protein
MSLEPVRSPTLRRTSRSTSKGLSKGWAALLTFTTCIELIQVGSVLLRHFEKPIQVGAFRFLLSFSLYNFLQTLTNLAPAKIDAVQAEYSAFETVHEQDGLIETAKELGIAFVAFSPLGHGWLVDDFPFNSPDEFAPDDFRRKGM